MCGDTKQNNETIVDSKVENKNLTDITGKKTIIMFRERYEY